MPLMFLAVGILFLVLARNGTQGDFEQLLKSEFSGSQSFIVWASAIVLLGLLGFFKPVRPVTDAMIGLIVLVLLISNQGFFAKFNAALRDPVAPAAPAQTLTPSQALIPGAIGGQYGTPVIAPGTTPGLPQGGTVGVMPTSEQGLL